METFPANPYRQKCCNSMLCNVSKLAAETCRCNNCYNQKLISNITKQKPREVKRT